MMRRARRDLIDRISRMRPKMRLTLRLAGSGTALALLAACATTPVQTAGVPVAQETQAYRAHARAYYAPPGPADDPWGPYITEASRKFDVPDTWVRAVIGRESGGQQFSRNGTLTTSGAGAMGLMQLMAPTYDELRSQYGLGDDAFEPHDNIMAGTAYIRQMYDIYGAPGFLAAYNTGPGRLDDFLTRNRPLPRETRQYVSIIGPQIAGIWPNSRSQADLLVAARTGGDTSGGSATQSADETHSVRLAWTGRRDLAQGAQAGEGQPVQVAEAPAVDDTSGGAAGGGGVMGVVMPLAQPASVAPSGVAQAWAARGVVGGGADDAEAALPTPIATPMVARRSTPSWSTPVRPAPIRLASAEMPAPRRFRADTTPHDWAVQVGAFGTQAQANHAADAAQSRAPSLSGGRAEIAGIREGRQRRVFRARLTGLSRAQALQACERLAHGRGDCMVVSPDARS